MLVYYSLKKIKSDIESQVFTHITEDVLLKEAYYTDHNAFKKEHSTPKIAISSICLAVCGCHQDKHQFGEYKAEKRKGKGINARNKEC